MPPHVNDGSQRHTAAGVSVGHVPVQLMHSPLEPHVVSAFPATQAPPLAAEQHPPLHNCAAEQASVQVFVAVSQA